MYVSVCAGPEVAHVPAQKSTRSGGRVYYLYKAAEHGCLACVKHLVDIEGMDPKQASANRGTQTSVRRRALIPLQNLHGGGAILIKGLSVTTRSLRIWKNLYRRVNKNR